MNNKDLKDSRTRKFFIDAAKEIIMGEKITALNVREIAQRAGYSPATLYAYFKDLNDLTIQCIDSFLDDLEVSVKIYMQSSKDNLPDLVKFYKAYTQYFIQYVGIYQLLFLDPQSLLSNHKSIVDKLFGITRKMVDTSRYDEKVLDIINFSVNGLLLFYLNKIIPKTYQDFAEEFVGIFKIHKII